MISLILHRNFRLPHLTALLAMLTACANAAVPIAWTVETSRLQPVAFDALHGETLELAASFQSYGKPLEITGEAALYYQTNGMGSAWWQIPATVHSNRIEAVFTPANDPGASRLICFLGGTASTYRAAFTLRFANSPGARPNVMPWPSTHAEAAEIISNIVTRYYLQDHLTPSVDRNSYTAPRFTAAPNPSANGLISQFPVSEYNNTGIRFYRQERSIFGGLTRIVNNFLFPSNINEGGMIATREYINALDFAGIDYVDAAAADTLEAAKAYADENGGAVSSVNGEIGDVQLTAAKVGAASKEEMDTVWNFLMAENFRVTITNYDSTAHAPESSYEFRMSTNEPWRIVWTETNGLARAHTAATNDALKAAKAEIAKPENRAWGRYDATTGAPAPEGIVQVSAEGGLMIGGGMGYTSVAASGGEYWVLTSTDPTICRTGKNGVFEIIDSSGNAAVSVRKGDKRLVPAPAGGISITANEITIVYSIESAEHPEIECSATLTGGGTWYTPGEDGAPFGAATWSGSSGAWSVTIPKSGAQMGFLRASYYTGGGTVVSYGEAAIEMPKIKIGNVEYKVGTATISGHTVLTLTP